MIAKHSSHYTGQNVAGNFATVSIDPVGVLEIAQKKMLEEASLKVSAIKEEKPPLIE